MANERKPASVSIPSDALRALLNLRDVPFLRPLLEDVIQIVLVLDASAVQGELRWRLGSRTNPTARTGLHEAIDSGVVIAVAVGGGVGRGRTGSRTPKGGGHG